MIKINLLPGYIVERRRVKALAALLIFFLVVELLAFAAYVWAPMPFSLTRQWQRAEERRQKAAADALEVQQIETEIGEINGRFSGLERFVVFVDEADALPGKWIEYFKRFRKYIPADVVLNGLPLPSGNSLNLSGSTSGLMAAARWYLNMLRCEMVQRDPNAVSFSTDTSRALGGRAATAGNPKMQQSVSISVVLRPEYLDIINLVPAPPSGVTGGAVRRGGARMGGGVAARGGARTAARGARRGRGGRRGRRF